MAITKNRESKKSPSQNPTAFYKSVQSGGTNNEGQFIGTTVPDKLTGGPMRERIMGEGRKA